MNNWNKDWHEEEIDPMLMWDDLVENDEASSSESGFMQGYYQDEEDDSY